MVWENNALKLDASRVIDRKIYVDDHIHAAEQERLFAKTWQWVAHESEIPEFGDYITVTVAGRALVVVRSEDGSIDAFFNTCTHRGAILAPRARGNCGGDFVCLYHGWCFDTAGKLTAVPLDQAYGEGLKKACYDIPKIRCETFAGHVFVCLDASIAPLVEYLGNSASYIETATADGEALGRVRWKIKGNWKLWHENFRDNYHPMFAHMLLTLNYQGVKIEGTNRDLANGHSVLQFPSQGNPNQILSTISKVTGRKLDTPSAFSEQRARGQSQGTNLSILAIFPNLDFQYTSNPASSTLLQTVRPVGVDSAIVEAVLFGRKDDTDEMRQARLETALDSQTAAGKISGDDNEAVRRCEIGFSTFREVRWSNMDRGQAPGSQGAKNDEYSLRAFYSLYKQYMGDALLERA